MTRTALGAGTLLVLALLAAVVAGGAVSAQTGTDAGAPAASNASFGANVSSFMQASSADATTAVGGGMFQVALNRADSRAARRAIIERRQRELAARERRLRAMRDRLSTGAPGVIDFALAARVNVGAAGLEVAANRTARAAEAAGLDTAALAELRANASEMRGAAVAELARSLAGGPGFDVGPPPGVGPDGDPGPPADPGAAGNGTTDSPASDVANDSRESDEPDEGGDTAG